MKCITVLSLFCVVFAFAAAEPMPVSGSITSVIVYRGQALVSRSLQLPDSVGDMELLVENLPEKILPDSLYAQSDGSISVLSVRYREQVIQEDTREQVLQLKEQIQALQRQIQNAGFNMQNVMDRIDRYREQWKLSVDSANADLNRGILQPEAVQKLTEFLERKSIELHKEVVRLTNEKQDLEKQCAELDTKLQRLSAEQQKILRQALVYVSRTEKGKAQISLSYLVRDANWSPQYNLRAAQDRKIAGVEYNAVVHQSSGENWENTQLFLSTAQPSVIAAPPMLSPMQVTLGVAGQRGNDYLYFNGDMPDMQKPAAVAGDMKSQQPVYLDQTQVFSNLAKSKKESIAKGINAQRELNSIAISNQMIELEADRRMLMEMKERVAVVTQAEGVSVMYSLRGKLSLPSRTEQQMLNIASFECPAEFIYIASPLLTDYVYLQADVTNTSDTILLPGAASMFRNGEFVGRSDLKLVTSGQTFTAGFGIDSQIQVVREFQDKKTDTFLGSRQNEQQYRIALSNYKAAAVKLRLLERIPWTENNSLAIELKDTSHPLCEDAEYLRTERSKGLLRWDMELNAGSFGAKVTVVTYSYTMKYDKSMSVVPTGQ